jgi:hypothetical protein
MRASARIRQYATKFATNNPEVAFDLLDLASKVAEDEKGQDQGQSQQQKQGQDQDQSQDQSQQKQGGEMPPALKKHMEEKEEGKEQGQGQQQKEAYVQLKSACMKVARDNPAQRAALLPILRVIKEHG